VYIVVSGDSPFSAARDRGQVGTALGMVVSPDR
jgi:hypothetical protein